MTDPLNRPDPSADGLPDRGAGRTPCGHAVGRQRDLLVGALADRLPAVLRGARWEVSGRAAIGIVLVAVVAVTAAWIASGPDDAPTGSAVAATFRSEVTDEPISAVPSDPSTTAIGAVGTGGAPTVVVHVAGLVVAPGVYELPGGSRVGDAVDAAGGPQPGVDLSTLNLARVLVDGEQVAVGVSPAPGPSGAPSPSGTDGAGDPAGPLDLNAATAADLDELPGVGPVLAERIVAWRDEHGRFTSVDELLEVSGIGTATLADIAPLVRV